VDLIQLLDKSIFGKYFAVEIKAATTIEQQATKLSQCIAASTAALISDFSNIKKNCSSC
jgi:hypothetical protein